MQNKFTDEQRAEAAVEANRLGKILQVVNGELVLVDPTPPTQAELDTLRKQEILQLLADIDAKSARPLRAVAADTATEDDLAAIAELESRAQDLRKELIELQESEVAPYQPTEGFPSTQ